MVILIDAERTPGYSVYTSSKAKSILSNFDVHNDYNEPIDNFELELFGPWVPNDVTWWFPGSGVPPRITSIPGGIEILWIQSKKKVA